MTSIGIRLHCYTFSFCKLYFVLSHLHSVTSTLWLLLLWIIFVEVEVEVKDAPWVVQRFMGSQSPVGHSHRSATVTDTCCKFGSLMLLHYNLLL